mgnify:CR=1 FL=1
MENASKALLISAEVLIGIILASLMVFLYVTMSSWGRGIEENINIKEVYEFNAKFTVYDQREDLTAQDVVSIINLAKNYNEKYEGINFKIDIQRKSSFPGNNLDRDLLKIDTNKFLINGSLKSDNITSYLYRCDITEYENVSLVSKIEIRCINYF